MNEFHLLDWQRRACEQPIELDVALLGARAGGKSTCLIGGFVLQYIGLFDNSRIAILRKSFPGLADITALTHLLFPLADPGAKWNGQAHAWTFSNGSIVELGILESERDFARWQGRNFHVIAIEEAGQFGDPRLLDLMRSCLRSSDGRPVRFLLSANPGGPGHHWLHRRYVLRATPWEEFIEPISGRASVTITSTMFDNEHIDAVDYQKQLSAACAGDPELLRAWVHGDWNIARGAYFGDVLDESKVMTADWDRLPDRFAKRTDLSDQDYAMAVKLQDGWPQWNFFLALDWGVAAPAVCYFVAESPGAEGPDGRYYPRNSLVLFDEYDTRVSDDDLNNGTGLTVAELAGRLVGIANQWGMSAIGAADDSIFSSLGTAAKSIAEEFSRNGVEFQAANKADRISGLQHMRTLLSQAGMPDKPGLYVAKRCSGFWSTVPFLPRDPRRREDLDSHGPDHWADAARYAITYSQPVLQVVKLPRVR